MKDRNSILVMTGNKLRHQYFALKILEKFPSARLLIEKQPPSPWGAHVPNDASPLIKKHFNDFCETEKKYFEQTVKKGQKILSDRLLKEIEEGSINRDKIVEHIKQLNPALIIVLSTSLLQENFISAFPHKIINLHAGLSPYYRGSGTNIFPFYHNELEYVGMTVHYIDIGIDSGDIILQGRPVFEDSDTTHTIGSKNVILGTNLMIKVIDAYLKNGPPKGHAQNTAEGHLYYRKNFNESVINQVYRNIEKGIVQNYVRVQPKPVKHVENMTYD